MIDLTEDSWRLLSNETRWDSDKKKMQNLTSIKKKMNTNKNSNKKKKLKSSFIFWLVR